MIELDINASTASFMPCVVGLSFIPYTDWELKATIEAVIPYVDSPGLKSLAPLLGDGLSYFFVQRLLSYF